MNRQSRAKQFMPFNALKGYYKLIKEKEKIRLKQHEIKKLTDEEINFRLKNLKRFEEVEIIFKNGTALEKVVGIISKIDKENKQLLVINKTIHFEDIIDINI